jgi:sigma-B regulation protein RsbU (phosphoserine phosphatase)
LYVAVLNLHTGKLTLLNGGHLPPLLSRQGGAFEEMTGARGVLLGIMPSDRFTTAEITLQPGDRILFYTDGVTEAENLVQEQFGLARTCAALNLLDPTAGMEALVAGLVKAVAVYAGEAEQSDDITVLGLKYLANA